MFSKRKRSALARCVRLEVRALYQQPQFDADDAELTWV